MRFWKRLDETVSVSRTFRSSVFRKVKGLCSKSLELLNTPNRTGNFPSCEKTIREYIATKRPVSYRPSLAERLLALAKAIERRVWWFQTPLRQLADLEPNQNARHRNFPEDALKNLEAHLWRLV